MPPPLPVKVEYRIGIQVPPELVWSFVSDIGGWPAWNPVYPKAQGEVQFGAELALEEAFPGEPPRAIRPRVLDWTPNEQIIWTLASFGGLLRETRYIEIEKLSDAGVIFSNGVLFEGPLRHLINRHRQRVLKAGFRAMGEAVRERAEAAFKSAASGAT